jgi:tRNA pseudouridine55 synthase
MPARAASSGVLPVDKGAGVTSFQVVAHVRRLLRASKLGHGGTLDPDATGVLPLLVGEATKLMPYLADLDKEYVATARLGVVTDTQDLSGTVLTTRPVPPLAAGAVEAVLGRFVGDILQVPPMYSALHHEGKRLYEIAREGGTVDRPARHVRIHAIALEALAQEEFTLRVRCGSGTYVRTLVADVGEALGCGAALARLTRTRVGPYHLASAVAWTELAELRDGQSLWARLLPSDSALADRPAVVLDAGQARGFAHGQSVAATPAVGGPDAIVRVYGPEGQFIGIGVRRGADVKPERILHADPARTSVLPV